MLIADRQQLTENLHESNRRMQLWLEHLLPADRFGEAPVLPPTPQNMLSVLSELMKAGESLRALPPDPDARLEQELAEYRTLVERLRTLLPIIYAMLLKEKTRLEQERGRLQSAAQWAQLSRQTL